MATWIHLGWWYFRPSCARQPSFTLSTPSSRVTSHPPTLSPARLYSYNFSGFLAGRETREGWPLLTVETEVNGSSKRTNENGVLSWLVRWACRAGTRDFLFCLGCSIRPSTKYFFPHRTLLPFLCPIGQQAGQAAVLGRLSVIMCLCGWLCQKFGCRKKISLSAISVLRPNFSQSYYTRTAPDDENFSLFLRLLALDLYLLYGSCILYDVGKNSTNIFSAKALLMICFINANKTCNEGTVLFKAMRVGGGGG